MSLSRHCNLCAEFLLLLPQQWWDLYRGRTQRKPQSRNQKRTKRPQELSQGCTGSRDIGKRETTCFWYDTAMWGGCDTYACQCPPSNHRTIVKIHCVARDEDGDDFHEVHVNTMEGFWSLLRSWLHPHQGISQEKLPLYLGFFEFVHNVGKRGKTLLHSLVDVLVK